MGEGGGGGGLQPQTRPHSTGGQKSKIKGLAKSLFPAHSQPLPTGPSGLSSVCAGERNHRCHFLSLGASTGPTGAGLYPYGLVQPQLPLQRPCSQGEPHGGADFREHSSVRNGRCPSIAEEEHEVKTHVLGLHEASVLSVVGGIRSEKGQRSEHQVRSVWARHEGSVTAGPGPVAGAAQRPPGASLSSSQAVASALSSPDSRHRGCHVRSCLTLPRFARTNKTPS